MADTYTQLFFHVVFAVQGRQKLISPKWEKELYKYICGIAVRKEQKVFAINGVADHLHLLISTKPDMALSHLVGDLKANSSKWVNDNKLCPFKFQWQAGYGGFTHSKRELDTVIGYIDNQEKHHEKQSFRAEYMQILDEAGIVFQENYLFEF
jgi:putative transposase